MKKFTLIAFLIVCCFFTNGTALTNSLGETETAHGKIEMDLPDAPVPKVEVNLDSTFFSLLINFGIASDPKLTEGEPIDLAAYTEYAEMLKGASIRTYDKETKNLDQIVNHYQGILEGGKWECLVKIKDKFDLNLLYAEKSGVVHGIFLMFTDGNESSFVNIYGEIDVQKLGVLFGRFLESNSEEPISKTVRNWVNAPTSQRWKVNFDLVKPDGTPELETETNGHSK